MTELRYTVVRGRRKTLVLTVSDGKVCVRAPLYVSDEMIADFVASREDWIRKKLDFYGGADGRFTRVRAGETVLVGGEQVPVRIGAARNSLLGSVLCLRSLSSVRTWAEGEADARLVRRTQELARATGLFPTQILLRDFKARWGSCDVRRTVSLNWRLVMLPPALADYVILHELCHLRELNHSRAFWALVERFCPAYRSLRKELKEYSFLTLFYRKK